jgi:uncharacterized protein YbjT (DUF2867 family)
MTDVASMRAALKGVDTLFLLNRPARQSSSSVRRR